jgi:hypothetical protein
VEGWTDTAITLAKYCNMLNIEQLYYGLLSPLLIWNYCDSNFMFGKYFFNIFDVLEYKGIFIYHYGVSLLHTFSLVLQPWMSTYIRKTDGVCISAFQKNNRITTWPTKIFTLHWINCIIPNNKCIFTQSNAVFTLCLNKNILLDNSVTKHQIDSANS